MSKNLPPNGELTSDEKKINTLSDLMYERQPQIMDFRGCPGYPIEMLERDLEYYEMRMAENANGKGNNLSDDIWARGAEPLFTYMMGGGGGLFQLRSFAFLASGYDDICNGTDVCLGMQNLENDKYDFFSIDVATGTNPNSIKEKFDRAFQQHGQTPPMASYIKYCAHDKRKWREPEAPHFIIGLAPAQIQSAFNDITITNGKNKGQANLQTPEIVTDKGPKLERERSGEVDFMVLAEIHEQIKMQRAFLLKDNSESARNRMEVLNNLRRVVYYSLLKTSVLDITGETKEKRMEQFNQQYPGALKKMRRYDSVFDNIVHESRVMQKRARGLYANYAVAQEKDPR